MTGDGAAMNRDAAASDSAILAELAALARTTAPELDQFTSLTAAHQYRRLYATVRRHVRTGASVLDWGSGNGHFSYFLLRAGYRVTAYSFPGADFQRWLPGGNFRFVGGSEREPVELPFADATFDCVTSIGVLEHVRETGGEEAANLAELTRVLRPGGTFVCWHFPNQWSWLDAVARAVPGKHHHAWRYTRDDVRRLVAGAGLELIENQRYGVLPRNSARRFLGSIGDARWAAGMWDALDRALELPLGIIAQNHGVVARKETIDRDGRAVAAT